MSDDSRGITRRIWLLLAKEGGRWSTEDIASELMEVNLTVHQTCSEMVRTGTVVKYERDEQHKRIRWGVTPVCKVPGGITVRELDACGVLKVGAAA